MASTSETGHAKNVANFDDLISFVTGYGTAYNPSKITIKLTALQTLSTSAKTAINTVNAALPAYSNAVAAREAAFEPLSKLITRVNNALKATDTTEQVDESAKTLVRKIQGSRATAKKTEEEIATAKAEGKETKEISSSQMSYDSRLDNFDKLIKLLTSVTLYAPNEADLKVTALTTLYNDLKTKNTAVVIATTPLSNARISRNDILYKPNTGLVDIALDTKTYIKSLYGATSPQYKQVSKLEFKAVKI
ncbi:MAG: hypothetical protein PHW83_06910 [Bacteroidales bacterium]|nr:hypothetical protein [Bacteroidales bacterium]